jgi:outer membrane protein TolC
LEGRCLALIFPGKGEALSTQLIDSETALVAARVRRAEAEADQQIAIAALRKALALPQLDPGSNSERK